MAEYKVERNRKTGICYRRRKIANLLGFPLQHVVQENITCAPQENNVGVARVETRQGTPRSLQNIVKFPQHIAVDHRPVRKITTIIVALLAQLPDPQNEAIRLRGHDGCPQSLLTSPKEHTANMDIPRPSISKAADVLEAALSSGSLDWIKGYDCSSVTQSWIQAASTGDRRKQWSY